MAQHTSDRAADAPVGRSPLQTVVVHGSDVSVDRVHSELPQAEARDRFGGVDVLSVLGGALAGLGTAVLLGGIASAVGLSTASFDDATGSDELVVGSAVAALVLLALSALVAGWVAGRASRFDGMRNGLLAGLLLPLLLALMGATGAYSAAENGVPVSLDGDTLTTAAIVAALVGLVVGVLLGALGGKLGARWHRDVDDVLIGTRPGAVTAQHGDRQTGRHADTDEEATR